MATNSGPDDDPTRNVEDDIEILEGFQDLTASDASSASTIPEKQTYESLEKFSPSFDSLGGSSINEKPYYENSRFIDKQLGLEQKRHFFGEDDGVEKCDEISREKGGPSGECGGGNGGSDEVQGGSSEAVSGAESSPSGGVERSWVFVESVVDDGVGDDGDSGVGEDGGEREKDGEMNLEDENEEIGEGRRKQDGDGITVDRLEPGQDMLGSMGIVGAKLEDLAGKQSEEGNLGEMEKSKDEGEEEGQEGGRELKDNEMEHEDEMSGKNEEISGSLIEHDKGEDDVETSCYSVINDVEQDEMEAMEEHEEERQDSSQSEEMKKVMDEESHIESISSEGDAKVCEENSSVRDEMKAIQESEEEQQDSSQSEEMKKLMDEESHIESIPSEGDAKISEESSSVRDELKAIEEREEKRQDSSQNEEMKKVMYKESDIESISSEGDAKVGEENSSVRDEMKAIQESEEERQDSSQNEEMKKVMDEENHIESISSERQTKLSEEGSSVRDEMPSNASTTSHSNAAPPAQSMSEVDENLEQSQDDSSENNRASNIIEENLHSDVTSTRSEGHVTDLTSGLPYEDPGDSQSEQNAPIEPDAANQNPPSLPNQGGSDAPVLRRRGQQVPPDGDRDRPEERPPQVVAPIGNIPRYSFLILALFAVVYTFRPKVPQVNFEPIVELNTKTHVSPSATSWQLGAKCKAYNSSYSVHRCFWSQVHPLPQSPGNTVLPGGKKDCPPASPSNEMEATLSDLKVPIELGTYTFELACGHESGNMARKRVEIWVNELIPPIITVTDPVVILSTSIGVTTLRVSCNAVQGKIVERDWVYIDGPAELDPILPHQNGTLHLSKPGIYKYKYRCTDSFGGAAQR